MRALILLLSLVFALPAFAADWQTYSNARFGYSIDVPPGFAWGAESDNGDGRQFRDGATILSVWGGNLTEPDFESAVKTDQGLAQQDGWNITYEASTPSWASFSGTNGNRVLYERMIVLCDTSQIAGFLLQYSVQDMSRLDAIVNRLVRSLKADGC